jgi:hypothetical protein
LRFTVAKLVEQDVREVQRAHGAMKQAADRITSINLVVSAAAGKDKTTTVPCEKKDPAPALGLGWYAVSKIKHMFSSKHRRGPAGGSSSAVVPQGEHETEEEVHVHVNAKDDMEESSVHRAPSPTRPTTTQGMTQMSEMAKLHLHAFSDANCGDYDDYDDY